MQHQAIWNNQPFSEVSPRLDGARPPSGLHQPDVVRHHFMDWNVKGKFESHQDRELKRKEIFTTLSECILNFL